MNDKEKALTLGKEVRCVFCYIRKTFDLLFVGLILEHIFESCLNYK